MKGEMPINCYAGFPYEVSPVKEQLIFVKVHMFTGGSSAKRECNRKQGVLK
jgi:hypothetical protein